MAKNRKKKSESSPPNDSERPEESEGSPLVFISHDSRDADLAEAFAMLLTDASGGVLKSFRSSDKIGTAGIEFGVEWYSAIMQKLDEATDVVALLTSRSLNRPWILYETGVAKGKLNRTVLGLALGVSLEKAAVGPFAQFQNSGDDEDSITKLVLQLIQRHPDAEPRHEAVRLQVQAFRQWMARLLESRQEEPFVQLSSSGDISVAKLFEEIKLQIRDLPSIATSVRRLEQKLLSSSNLNLRGTTPVVPLEMLVADKPIRFFLARSWQVYLKKLGWPVETVQAQEFLKEVGNWFAQEPARLEFDGKIILSHGKGEVFPQPDGIMLRNFKPAIRPRI